MLVALARVAICDFNCLRLSEIGPEVVEHSSTDIANQHFVASSVDIETNDVTFGDLVAVEVVGGQGRREFADDLDASGLQVEVVNLRVVEDYNSCAAPRRRRKRVVHDVTGRQETRSDE